ncbi:hypothetical protein H7F50_19455 [Novosphingobium flavum]|uniref:hypothetical protein n=1 Tax=Novosphingobium aerophilum TaxID=2839843 RepID=UPI00163A610F|nr:hypothetical protein [Novosphingobium aerophilum]MBC2663884.1 hypothetical protein [Novosphingobium aerophilum]
MSKGAESFGESLVQNIKGAGVGALSSYLVAEVTSAIGLDGFAGEAANSVGSAVVSKIINNLTDGDTATKAFSGVDTTLIASAAASFLGGKLASAISTPESIGGQIGAQVGAAYGSWVAGNLIAASGFNPATFVAAVVIVAFWQLVGGLIGSIFGGTPRSGADVVWDPRAATFAVSNVWARKGGSQEAARNLASAVSTNLSAVLGASGSVLLDPQGIQYGSYGMVKREYVYRPQGGGSDQGQITARFSGQNGAQALVTHGTYIALNSMLGKMSGGNIFVKRAISGNIALSSGNPSINSAGAAGKFDVNALLGDVSIGRDYSTYFANRASINYLRVGFETHAERASRRIMSMAAAA